MPHLYPLARSSITIRATPRCSRHQQGGDLHLRAGRHRTHERSPTQDPAHVKGRLVAGTLPAPRRQRALTPHQGSDRDTRKAGREEQLQHIVVAGDESALAIFRDQLPKELADKLIDIAKLGSDRRARPNSPGPLEALREKDAETDAEKVQELMDAWRSGGLGVAGPEATLSASSLARSTS